MKQPNSLLEFVFREWLLLASAFGLAAVSLYLKHIPWLTVSEQETLVLLWLLLVAVKGLENNGLLAALARRVDQGRLLPLKLVLLTFGLSAVVTNDVALVVVVPLTLSLNVRSKEMLVILEAFAANVGSAFTPFGNPQNILIFRTYHVGVLQFFKCIAPFSGVFLSILAVAALCLKTTQQPRKAQQPADNTAAQRTAYIWLVLLSVVVLSVLRVLPLAAGVVVPVWAVLFDRRSLKVDYLLLATFFCFFSLSEGVLEILPSRLEHSAHIFVLSAFSSQFISNVPAAAIFAKFTTQWRSLLWGTNVGGFGSLVASFANLIAYKFYVAEHSLQESKRFAVKFVGLGYVMFLLGLLLYWSLQG